MPPKMQNIIKRETSNTSKPDIADRVRELKARQENWFRERSQESHPSNVMSNGISCYGSKERTAPDSESSPDMVVCHVSQLKHQSDYINDHKNIDIDARVPYTSNGVQNGFKNWLEVTSNNSSNDDLEEKANAIAQRVKREMSASSIRRPSNKEGSRELGTAVSRLFTENDDQTKNTSPMISHCCQICSHLMVRPNHQPILCVPCGHTVCSSCLSNSSSPAGTDGGCCPICHCIVRSRTCNIMLQQIILEHHNVKPKRLESDSEGLQDKKRSTRPNDETALEELNNLELRCEVLTTEEDNILTGIQRIDNKIKQEQKQVDSIEMKKNKIMADIEELQSRIEALQRQKLDCADRCNEYRIQRDGQNSKLKLLRTTLAELRDDACRIRARLARPR